MEDFRTTADYLAEVSAEERALLNAINRRGLTKLRLHLQRGEAVAVLGAGTSAPLYPLWTEVIHDLLDHCADRFSASEIATYTARASTDAESIVEIIQSRDPGGYRERLREIFRTRRDARSGRAWTPAQELIARCRFRGVVTTNYDPGIVNARMAVRPDASATGFASWTDEDAIERWRTGDVFDDDELPVLYAHGHHNQPDAIVLARGDYRRAYSAGLSRTLLSLVDTSHLVWIGFSFSDRRLRAILDEIDEKALPRISRQRPNRHIAILPWVPPESPTDFLDPRAQATAAEIEYGCSVILYPAPASRDHTALLRLLQSFTDPHWRATPISESTRRVHASLEEQPSQAAIAKWVHGGSRSKHFTGRGEELAKLDRWGLDSEVRLIGVTAWGGAGKTALITQWLTGENGAAVRPGIRGLFAWSFYAKNSIETWASELLRWTQTTFAVDGGGGGLPDRILRVMSSLPLILVLDGLEVAQEAAQGLKFGHMINETLRNSLSLLCQLDHQGLIILTSRFPFADLEQFDGSSARMLDVPPLTVEEGAALLGAAGASWLPDDEKRRLVTSVDGHALAVGVLAASLATEPLESDLDGLTKDLARATRTNSRVGHVLAFYARRLSPEDRQLVGIVSLFQRPLEITTILAVSKGAGQGSLIARWTITQIEMAIRRRLSGLLEFDSAGLVSAHPLVREAFRPFVMSGRAALEASDVMLAELPHGPAQSRNDAHTVVEMLELLLDAGQVRAADDLYRIRTNDGRLWIDLPAADLGLRSAYLFVGTQGRRATSEQQIGQDRLVHYLNAGGVFGSYTGESRVAEDLLLVAVEHHRRRSDDLNAANSLRSLADLLCSTGDTERARAVAEEALRHSVASHSPMQRYFILASLAVACHHDGDRNECAKFLGMLERFVHERNPCTDYQETMIVAMLAGVLLDSGRLSDAKRLGERALVAALDHGWSADIARCDRIIGRCDTELGDLPNGRLRLTRAVETFRRSNYHLLLTMALGDLAELERRAGDPLAAGRLATEAISLAGPRRLFPSHARSLAARAMARADEAKVADADRLLARARDDANSALRLSTVVRRQPWSELAALRAHAHIDTIEQVHSDWSDRADKLFRALTTKIPRARGQIDELAGKGPSGKSVIDVAIAGDLL